MAIFLLTCPFFLNDHCRRLSRPPCVRTGTAALGLIHRMVVDRAPGQEETDAREFKHPLQHHSAADGMDLPQLKIQTSSLPSPDARRPAICRYNFTDAGTLTWMEDG